MSADDVKATVQAALTSIHSPTPARRCKRKSKRTGEQCKAWVMGEGEVCYHHGAKSRRGQESGQYVHGEKSKYIRRTAIAEALQAADTAPEAIVELTLKANMADRRQRREKLTEEGDLDLDVADRLDAGDRGDSAVLLKASEQARAIDKPETGFNLTIQQPGSTSISVRTMNGMAVAIKAPDGALLLEATPGQWVKAICREVDDVEIWSPLILEGGQ